ncbi:histidine phosphatase family protein [Dyella sp. GSA-30]|uniref:histidine phosphatase family protein n=1 Tax=Dyella sp. GSA-30 TaxID=2994496 RepID=UPI0024934302|nr:histidine phosphatase family protein [Dyella sp. GSA-30]BDU20580.1 phosphoglycerate mutase [Dyella sp. GSA-30]
MNITALNEHPTLEIWLIRHGETEWSLSGQHTGRTNVPLTEHGREQARSLAPLLAKQSFDVVLTSPMSRAIETCREAGLGVGSRVEPDLSEWNYGIYEGRTTTEIRATVPGWTVWNSPVPEGESIEQIQLRANALIQRLLAMRGRVALFSHGHFLRVLGGCWMNGLALTGSHLLLDTATVSVLGFERETRALRRWNSRGD